MTDIKNNSVQNILFKSNGLLLSGHFHEPDVNSFPIVIGSHGLFSDSSSPKQIELGSQLSRSKIGFFRFDHTGCGNSQGDFKNDTTIMARFNDICSAIKTIKEKYKSCKEIGVFGSSMGGSIALLAAIKLNIDAIVTLAAPVKMDSVWDILVKNGQDKLLSSEFYNEAKNFNINSNLTKIKNILIFHGSNDEVVPLSNAHLIHENAVSPKKLIVFKNGCHRLSDLNHQKIFIEETVKWFKELFKI